MRTMTRKIGFTLGAALTALLLFGLGKGWAGTTDRAAAGTEPQTISKGDRAAAATSTPDDSSRNWRRGRRR